jgi:hypothetical protein
MGGSATRVKMLETRAVIGVLRMLRVLCVSGTNTHTRAHVRAQQHFCGTRVPRVASRGGRGGCFVLYVVICSSLI